MNAHNQEQFPANIEAEQALLGALLFNNAALRAIPETFSYEHFYEPVHRQIFEAIVRGTEQKKAVNAVTVRSFLPPEIAASKVGDITIAQYLIRLTTEAVSVINAPDYAMAITDYYNRREAMVIADDAYIAGARAQDELEFIDRIRDCRNRLNAIVATIESRNEPKDSFSDSIDQTLDTTGEAMAGRSAIGLDPGIPELYSLTGPWTPGQLIIIGGDVKTGKSALAWQTFFNIAEKHAVGGNSGEMPKSQIIMREKARRTGISAKRQKMGNVSSYEMDQLLKAGVDMKRLKPIDIDCRQLTIDQVDEKILRLQGECGIEAYYIDHLLKMAWTGKMEDADDFKKANRATSMLKNIALKRGIVIVALTHINKTSPTGGVYGKTFAERLNSARRTRPTFKSMLGNIDKDADNMIITHQARPAIAALEPESDTADYALWEAAMSEASGKAELILALSRENEFPRRRDIRWDGETTSYGNGFKQQQNERELF